jgi:hypothetical protein
MGKSKVKVTARNMGWRLEKDRITEESREVD